MARVRRQAAEWARLIDQWRASGLSLPAFCSQQGLKRGTMQNWVYKTSLKQAVEEARRQARSAETPRRDRRVGGWRGSADPGVLPPEGYRLRPFPSAPHRTVRAVG